MLLKDPPRLVQFANITRQIEYTHDLLRAPELGRLLALNKDKLKCSRSSEYTIRCGNGLPRGFTVPIDLAWKKV